MRFYEGFSWGAALGATALIAGTLGCSLHLHYGEKHFHGEGIEALRHEGTEGKEPGIEANPHGDAGIEIVIPDEGRSKIEDRS